VLVGQGCRFLLRCPHAMDTCVNQPPDVLVGAAHHALCWLYADGVKADPLAGNAVAG
jgi:ABC-type dipeptide/oligopeptide/nickel transport system ATPase component